MKRHIVLLIAGLVSAGFLGSCESPEAPSTTDGKIVLRFEPAAKVASLQAGNMAASQFDSVVVNVFRPGTPLRLEVSKGAAITSDDPINIAVGCIAENGKKVGVDLYSGRTLLYHGSNPDVDVIAHQTTPVSIDVYSFYVSSLTLTPPIIPDGAAFTLHWPAVPAATKYRLEESATPDFATIASSQSPTDTTIDVHVAPGSHYFRVRPTSPYATGSATPSKFGYVTGSSNGVKITAVDDAVIPGETIKITGENLDYPGTQATIGTTALSIESSAWGEIVARAPRNATTGKVTVSSTLGSDTSNKEVVVQRIAYVSATGEYATAYINLLAQHADDFGQSGVVSVPVAQLDTRDMSVFDIIIVAHDTGTLRTNWGGGQPARAAVIENSNANVIAIGKGGAIFLSLISNAASVPTTNSIDADRSYFENDKSDAIFNTPHSVGGPDLTMCTAPTNSLAFSIGSPYPAGVALYASTGKNCNLLGICSPNDQWALADFRFKDPDGTLVVYFFWGYASDPGYLTNNGSDCLGNVMNMLYKSVAPVD
jgi:hypothetical protein